MYIFIIIIIVLAEVNMSLNVHRNHKAKLLATGKKWGKGAWR